MTTLDLEQWLKLAQNLSFTGFLLLCVAVLTYALYRLYLYGRVDWDQVQQNAAAITQLNQNMTQLISRIDQLITELHLSAHTTSTAAALASMAANQNNGSQPRDVVVPPVSRSS